MKSKCCFDLYLFYNQRNWTLHNVSTGHLYLFLWEFPRLIHVPISSLLTLTFDKHFCGSFFQLHHSRKLEVQSVGLFSFKINNNNKKIAYYQGHLLLFVCLQFLYVQRYLWTNHAKKPTKTNLS
jgi:hypothetical protein